MRRPGRTGNGDGATGGHERRPAVAGRYGAEVGRHGKVRNGDAAPLPVPKRRCGATTASEAKMRRQGRNGQRRRPPPRPPRPAMRPPRRSAKAAQRPAEPPEDAPPTRGAASQARGRRRAQRAREWVTSGGAAARVGRHGGPGVSPRKIPRAIAKRTESPGAKGDAGWLRGQTTRRRIHRRSDGGPERRQVLRRGTRAPLCMLHRNPPLCVKTGLPAIAFGRCFS